MAKSTLDIGPAADQTVVVAIAVVSNIGLTITDRSGPVKITAGLTVDNAGAGFNTFTASLRKNGVIMAGTTRTIILIAASRQNVALQGIDLAAVAGDVYAIEVNVAAVAVPTLLILNQSSLIVEALSQDAAICAGVGVATA